MHVLYSYMGPLGLDFWQELRALPVGTVPHETRGGRESRPRAMDARCILKGALDGCYTNWAVIFVGVKARPGTVAHRAS